MYYVVYFSNGWIYSGRSHWGMERTRERAERCAGGAHISVIAVVGFKELLND